MKLLNVCCISVLAAAASGCATLLSQSSWPVYVQAAEGETEVVVKNAYGLTVKTGKTPLLLSLESGRGYFQRAVYSLTFSKPGYEDLTAVLPATFNYWYVGNIVNILGFFTADPATGAMWRLSDNVSVSLAEHDRYNPGLYARPTNIRILPLPAAEGEIPAASSP